MRCLPVFLLFLLALGPVALSQQRGVIDQAGFKQSGNRGAVQFTWRFEGLVQIPPPAFRGFLYCQQGDKPAEVLVAGEANPAFSSSQSSSKRSAPKGSERLLFELPAAATLHDYRVEMWLNGRLVAHRHSPRFTAAAFTAKGLDATWWEPKVGVVDAQLQQDIQSGIESGVAYLKKQQRADGSWVSDGEHTPGYTALAAMALIKTGTKPDAPEILKALRAIKTAKPHTTYEIGCTLMFLELVDPVAHKAWMEDLAETLARRQAQGTWDYEAGNGDLSNTQYGALGLWSANRSGIQVDTEVWRELAEALLDFNNPNGSFNYKPPVRRNPAHKGTLEMSAAGVGTAMIAQRFLQGDQKTEKLRPELADAGRSGFEAMGRLFDAEPSGYSLYGIERVGALIGKDLLGRRDWYIEGAKVFVERQEADGSVAERIGGPIAGTSFALLFWKRSTRTTMEPEYDPDAYLKEQMAAAAAIAGGGAAEAAAPAALDPVEAQFAERYPMAEPGKAITLRSSAGKSVSGTVVRLEADAIVLEVAGRSGSVPFSKLDKASRVRCDAAFRAQAIDAVRKRK